MSKTISAAAGGLPTRRTALASLAGLGAAASLPKAVKAGVGEPSPDPIFAAIEKHKAAWVAFEAACAPCGKVVGRDPPHLEEAREAAADAEEEARFDMHETVPQTIAGLAAYVAYWNSHMAPSSEGGTDQMDCIGWEAIPTIAEAMATLFPIGGAE